MGSRQVHSCPTCGRNQGSETTWLAAWFVWDKARLLHMTLEEIVIEGLKILCKYLLFWHLSDIQLQRINAEIKRNWIKTLLDSIEFSAERLCF